MGNMDCYAGLHVSRYYLGYAWSMTKRTMVVHGVPSAREQYYCHFGVNADHVFLLKQGQLNVVGSDTEWGIPRG